MVPARRIVALGLLAGAVLGPAGPALPVAGSGALGSAAVVCGTVETRPLPEAPWALTRLRPDLAWPLSRGAGVTVAVIDSGVSDDHPSVAGAVLPGRDMVGGGSGVESGRCDENGHGTLVAGLIAGRETVSYRSGGGGYLFAEQGGTSFAAAYVSGVVALVRAHEPGLTVAQVVERVTRTADHPPRGWSPQVGHGVVNPARAVGALSLNLASVAPAGQLASPVPAAVTRGAIAAAAPWVAVAAAVAALAVVGAVPVVRRGRQRGWRPGR